MDLPLIKTKFYVPRLRPTHVARPRLLDYLNNAFIQGDSFSRKLTTVCAPAGYGKTTLAIDWLGTLDLPVCWLSLDESDNDPVRFLTYLVHAIRQVHPEFGNAALGMLQSPQLPPPEALLTPLLNEIETARSPFVLLIDDYHLIQTPAIHQYLNFLADYQPPQMHTVVVSREDPPLPLHRYRARGEMLEIRQENIRFTLEETADFIENLVEQKLSAESLKTVEHRTEGWVTGMQLLALSLQEHQDADDFIRAFKGSDRFVLDYLFEEVFQRQPEEVQAFLLKTSILEHLTAGLCQAVTGDEDSRKILEVLDQSNLFILPIDHTHTWYRYHRLFLDLLRHRLRLQKEISQADLHRRASLWYEEEGYLEKAVNHALAGEDWSRAGELILQISDGLMKSGAIATLLGWFRQIPEEVICSKPEYCLTYGWPLVLATDVKTAGFYLNKAEEMAGGKGKLAGEIASAQAFLSQTIGDESALIEQSESALSLLPKSDLGSRSIVALNLGIAYWHQGAMEKANRTMSEAVAASRQTHNRYGEVTSVLFLGRVHAVRGQLQQAGGYFQRVIETQVRVPVVGLAYLDLSALAYEWNDLQAAESYLEQGIEWIGTRSNYEFQIAGLMQKTRLQLARGDQSGALETLDEGWKLETVVEIPVRTRARLAALMVEAAIAAGDLDLAQRWAEQVTIEQDSHPFYRFINLTPVRLRLAQNRLGEASAMLEEIIQTVHEAGWRYASIVLSLMRSVAAGDRKLASGYLREALSLAHPEKFIRSFLDQGPALIPLLKDAAHQGVYPEYVGEILAAYDETSGGILPPGVDSLSEREMEVLRLLAAGMTNREIADQLVVSISTVKSHVHHISAKLDASNRTQAVANARKLGML